MLAGTTRHDVGDGRQRASLEINEILREIDDVREEARRIDESGEGQEGSPDDLWTMCVLGAKGLLGVADGDRQNAQKNEKAACSRSKMVWTSKPFGGMPP